MSVEKDKPYEGGHAVVIGGSMAGLLAARVLTDHFARVTLVERDRFPEGAEYRKGVPQARHAHGLLPRGLEILSNLFPGIADELYGRGATPTDIARDMRWHHFGGYKVQVKTGMVGPMSSRPLLESCVRRRVMALPNLEVKDGHDVRGLVASSAHDGKCVTGVRLRGPEAGEETLAADLVVDAMGRGSRSPAWLEALGYPRPEETEIKVRAGYTTRIYRRKPTDVRGAKAVFLLPTPPQEKRIGALFPIEGDRWIVSVGGWLGDFAPTDEEGYLEFARSLPAPDIYEVIKDAQPLTDFVVHRFPSNLRRRYEKLARFPEGYLVLGDAVCSFNPIYGQGMSVSAMQAEALDECLREGRGELRGLPRRFFRRAAKAIDVPWMLAAGEDFRYPEVEGRKPLGTNFVNWYVGKLHRAATRDPEVCRAFFKVMVLTHPPTTLFDPRIAWRVLRSSWTARRAPRERDPTRELPEAA